MLFGDDTLQDHVALAVVLQTEEDEVRVTRLHSNALSAESLDRPLSDGAMPRINHYMATGPSRPA